MTVRSKRSKPTAPKKAAAQPPLLIKRARQRRSRRASLHRGWRRPGVVLAIGFLLGITFTALLGGVSGWLALIYWSVSAVTWYSYRLDKRAAQRGTWRIPEARLHLLALCGGWPGGLLAREIQRHKTQKQPFSAIFWLTVLMNCGRLVWIIIGEMP